jgi:hypothetical protein
MSSSSIVVLDVLEILPSSRIASLLVLFVSFPREASCLIAGPRLSIERSETCPLDPVRLRPFRSSVADPLLNVR